MSWHRDQRYYVRCEKLLILKRLELTVLDEMRLRAWIQRSLDSIAVGSSGTASPVLASSPPSSSSLGDGDRWRRRLRAGDELGDLHNYHHTITSTIRHVFLYLHLLFSSRGLLNLQRPLPVNNTPCSSWTDVAVTATNVNKVKHPFSHINQQWCRMYE